MKALKRFAASLTSVCIFASCSSEPLAGVYGAPFSEAIKIEQDGAVHWQPPKKATFHPDSLRFLGMLSRSGTNEDLHLILPSSSPYVGTAISISDDQKTLVVDWSSIRGTGTRSVSYTKQKEANKAQMATPRKPSD